MKRFLPLIIAFTLLFAGGRAYASAQENIAAVVNDSIITMTDVQDRTDLYLSGNKASPQERQELEHQALDKLIDEALQMQEAKKMEISVDQSRVTNGFAYVAKQNNLTAEEFTKQLKASGVNVDTLYAQIKAELAWSGVVSARLRPQINISEGEIDMTMDQLVNRSGKKQYHVAEILLNVPTAADDSDVRLKAEELAQKIKDGEKFSSIAHESSQAPGAGSGGDMGWVQQGQLAPELDHALQTLQPGQITAPIRSGNGYHILFLREARLTGDNPLAEPEPEAAVQQGPVVTLRQIVIPVNPKKDSNNVIAAKRARGLALKQEIKSCAALDKRVKEFPGQGTGDLGTGAQNSLQPPLRAIVEKLAVNELSDPLQSPGGWAMIMVCSRVEKKPPPVAAAPPQMPLDRTDEKTRESLADKIGAQRLNNMAEHYLRDLRAAAFIDKRI